MCEKKHIFGAWKIVFLQSLSFLQVIGGNNVSGPQVYPHIDFAWIGSSPSMCEKKTELEKLFFCKARLHLIRPQGVTPQKEKRTARKSSKLRIWQPYSRVPQILKVLCASYSWKYVARLGFEPFKFLYGEFLYNTLAVMWFPAGPVQQTWLRAMNWAMSLELSQGSIESLWAPCLALVVRAWYAKICAKAELCVDLRSFHDDEQVSR